MLKVMLILKFWCPSHKGWELGKYPHLSVYAVNASDCFPFPASLCLTLIRNYLFFFFSYSETIACTLMKPSSLYPQGTSPHMTQVNPSEYTVLLAT